MLRFIHLPCAALATMLASGCASVTEDGSYPSLERRAVELRLNAPDESSPPAPPPPPVTADLETAVSALEADAARGEAAFRAELARTERSVNSATASPAGSEAWFVAQAALSGLDQSRAATGLALAELDRLHLAAAMDGRVADAAMLGVAAARVAALAEAQRAAFARLSGLLRE